MYLARDTSRNELVAIKKVRLLSRSAEPDNEWELLKGCVSKYIVRYYDQLGVGGEHWVCSFC